MLQNKKLFLLDIDGTVCKGKHLLEGAREFVQAIKKQGGQFVFITNNATKSINDYIQMFHGMGIVSDHTNFVTASYATVQYLKKHYANRLIYVVGTDSFLQELRQNGIQITTDANEEQIACVLISYDNQLTYQKIQQACQLLGDSRVDYIATNPDLVCPTEGGYLPDCGSICEMIGHATKRTPYYIGKPQTDMVEYSLRQNPYTKEQTLVVGDRLYTDILCGIRAGVDTALVLTGEATEQDVLESDYKPTYTFQSIQALHSQWG